MLEHLLVNGVLALHLCDKSKRCRENTKYKRCTHQLLKLLHFPLVILTIVFIQSVAWCVSRFTLADALWCVTSLPSAGRSGAIHMVFTGRNGVGSATCRQNQVLLQCSLGCARMVKCWKHQHKPHFNLIKINFQQ